MRYVTMFGVLVLGLALLFQFVSVGADSVLLIAIGSILVGIGVLSGK